MTDNDLLVADRYGQVVGDGSMYAKAPQPMLGEKFGLWAGREDIMSSLRLPGGGMLMFDLERLTLDDYRSMRNHYQINISLMVLMFLMHETDWTIECDDDRIRQHCEENMRMIWTRLVRGICVGHWAGYAPLVLQYENDVSGRRVMIDQVKDLVPEECRVHWKEVDGYAPPGHAKPQHKIFDGIRQRGASFPIPIENCVHPDTPILCADLVWRPAGTLRVGQEIVAFDEQDAGKAGGLGGRAYRTAEIVVNNAGVKSCVEVRTDNDATVIASEDHPFLVRVPAPKPGHHRDPKTGRMMKISDVDSQKSKDKWVWKNAVDLVPGDKVAWFGHPWEFDDSRDAGWLAGMFDGEGNLTRLSADTPSPRLSVYQTDGVVLDKMKALLAEKGYDALISVDERGSRSRGINATKPCTSLILRGGRRTIMRFMGEIAPIRFVARDLSSLWDGAWLKIGKSVDLVTVTGVEPLGDQPIASIQTSCGTFITGGYLTHNSLWVPCLMEHGDYYGRKLLKPAFPSWFYSQIIHLFANRYFERFGEPTAVGRAPLAETFDVGNGVHKSGREIMENILQNLRNRSVVVLPNDRDPMIHSIGTHGGAWEWQIEYLESQMRGADFERYLDRLDEEMSLALFTPVLLFRTADVGSYNLGQAHHSLFMSMLNGLNGDVKYYIDRYLLPRMVDMNFSPNSPRAYWVPRKLGKDSQETLRAMMTSLITQKIAQPNLEELGTAIGMSVEEIKQVTADASQTKLDAKVAADQAQQAADLRPPPAPIRVVAPGGNATAPKGAGAGGVPSHNVLAVEPRIFERARAQIERAFREGKFDGSFKLDLGHRRQLVDALDRDDAPEAVEGFTRRIDTWFSDLTTLGGSLTEQDVTQMLGETLKAEIAKL